jgi:hypothetical protein
MKMFKMPPNTGYLKLMNIINKKYTENRNDMFGGI